ncbi:TIGR03086 family metal-binding protein [Kribbella deserti]|uniref:TIGR03086 family metal-binding protein n=1 Tax=Kribbella deserti TaxID=1926257 RepID=A0ABV6QTJ1_9ACTN
MDLRDLDHQAGAALGEVVSQVRPEQLWLPTPCPDWTLRGLIRHLVSENEGFAAAARDGSAPVQVWTGGRLGDDHVGAYRRSNAALAEAFEDEGALYEPMAVREFGTFPRQVALSFHLLDCIVHGWDVARAIDAPYDPPAELVGASLRIARQVPTDPATRGPGAAFDEVVEASGNPTDLETLLTLTGRTPTWTSPA